MPTPFVQTETSGKPGDGLFATMPGQWTPVLPLIEIGDGPVSFRVAGETLVAFRDAGGRPAALFDRCPHRGASLSLGTRLSDGSLQCRLSRLAI